MVNETKFDVIVVGAGPSGIACAITIARKGNRVLVIERASGFGTKNMFGGEVYLESIKELFPDIYENLPYERFTVQNNYVLLNEETSTVISYNKKRKDSATITRASFDLFMAESAKKEGAYFALNTVCTDIIKKEGKIIGIKTENEEIYSKIVVIAEGFNSILTEKIGLKKKTEPKSAILGIKEVIRLDKETINKRFNLKDNEGAMFQIFGGLNSVENEYPFGMGFLYTFKNFITIGLGLSMEDLKNGKIKPYEHLEKLKSHPFISKLIENGEMIEYSAHSIPEGGYNELPKLYDNGVIVIGDAANLVDGIHFEGTNLAIKSGVLAGDTCNLAISKNDFSKKILKNYKKELFKSFIISDMKAYKDVIQNIYKRKNSIFLYYPNKIREFFEIWTTSDNKNKKEKYKKFIISFLFKRSIKETFLDVISFVKCIIGVIF